MRCRINPITNGIHVRSWLAPDIVYILDRYLSSKWQTDPTDQSVWEGVVADSRRGIVAMPRALPGEAGRLDAADC